MIEGFLAGDQVDFMLPMLGLKAVLGLAVVAIAAAAKDDDDGPHQPELPEFLVVVVALRLSTAVSCVTDVALIIGIHSRLPYPVGVQPWLTGGWAAPGGAGAPCHPGAFSSPSPSCSCPSAMALPPPSSLSSSTLFFLVPSFFC